MILYAIALIPRTFSVFNLETLQIRQFFNFRDRNLPHNYQTMRALFTSTLLLTALTGTFLTTAGAAVIIAPATGFNITWDGNDGDHFDAAAPPDGAKVPGNLALASNGATPFSSSDLGPQLGITFHVAANLNDGFYGNSNSWISADADPGGAPAEAGVILGVNLFNL